MPLYLYLCLYLDIYVYVLVYYTGRAGLGEASGAGGGLPRSEEEAHGTTVSGSASSRPLL